MSIECAPQGIDCPVLLVRYQCEHHSLCSHAWHNSFKKSRLGHVSFCLSCLSAFMYIFAATFQFNPFDHPGTLTISKSSLSLFAPKTHLTPTAYRSQTISTWTLPGSTTCLFCGEHCGELLLPALRLRPPCVRSLRCPSVDTPKNSEQWGNLRHEAFPISGAKFRSKNRFTK